MVTRLVDWVLVSTHKSYHCYKQGC